MGKGFIESNLIKSQKAGSFTFGKGSNLLNNSLALLMTLY